MDSLRRSDQSAKIEQLNENWSSLKANNFQLLREHLEFGHAEKSIVAAILRDDVDTLKQCAEQPDFNANQPLTLSFVEFSSGLSASPTPLEYAAFHGATGSFKFLLCVGADHKLSEKSREAERHSIEKFAIAGGSIEIVSILASLGLKFTECISAAITYFRTELFTWLVQNLACDALTRASARLSQICSMSAVAGNVRTLLFAIDQKCDVNAKSRNHMPPLHCAIESCRFTAARLLLAHPLIKVNQKLESFETPLLLAARHGLTYIVDLLLQRGDVDPNAKDKDGCTALHQACEGNHIETVRLLLRFKGIDLSPRDPNSRTTPLHIAAKGGYPEIMKVLIEYDGPAKPVELNARDKKEATPLIIAAEMAHGSSTKVLLECPQIDLNAQDHEGRSALHHAAERGGGEVMQLLLAKKGINVNVRDRAGDTALHYSVRGGDVRSDVEAVRLLLKIAGIDRGIRNVCFGFKKMFALDALKVVFQITRLRWNSQKTRERRIYRNYSNNKEWDSSAS
jgi:ankyrin repeat protein